MNTSCIYTWEWTDAASAACPEHPGSLDVMSMTFSAVIQDAHGPCSVNTAHEPESSFTTSPSEYDTACILSKMRFQFRILKMTNSSMTQNELFMPLIPASSITSCFFLTVVNCHVIIFSSFQHYFSTAAFASGFFNAWGIGMNLCTKTIMKKTIHPFCV